MLLPEKRRLAKAIARAHEDGLIYQGLTIKAMQLVSYFDYPYLFWQAYSCNNHHAYLAKVFVHKDLTVAIGQVEECKEDIVFKEIKSFNLQKMLDL